MDRAFPRIVTGDGLDGVDDFAAGTHEDSAGLSIIQ
jgi:hypothetical protein